MLYSNFFTLSLFVNHSTSYSQINFWSYKFWSILHNKSSIGELRSPNNTNKEPYRKTSKGQFPVSIVSIFTWRNANIVFPFKLCRRNVNDRDAAIQCNICQIWVHLRCNKLTLVDYKYLQWSTDSLFCLSCCSTILPFGNLKDKDFSGSVLNKNYIETSNKSSFVLLKPPLNLTNFVNSRYFDFEQIAVSETRISKKSSQTSNVDLNNYSFESTPTESAAGGAMIYISNRSSYKRRIDLNMYKKPTRIYFYWNNSKKSNIVVGCVYKHPNIHVIGFNSLINQLPDKISKLSWTPTHQ